MLTVARRTSDAEPSSDPAAAHRNESFLKSAWHRLTHQHDNLKEDESVEKGENKDAEEPKKAAGGSG